MIYYSECIKCALLFTAYFQQTLLDAVPVDVLAPVLLSTKVAQLASLACEPVETGVAVAEKVTAGVPTVRLMVYKPSGLRLLLKPKLVTVAV